MYKESKNGRDNQHANYVKKNRDNSEHCLQRVNIRKSKAHQEISIRDTAEGVMHRNKYQVIGIKRKKKSITRNKRVREWWKVNPRKCRDGNHDAAEIRVTGREKEEVQEMGVLKEGTTGSENGTRYGRNKTEEEREKN